MTQMLTRIGPLMGADGTTPATRSDRESNTVVTQAHGKYTEACRRGNLFTTSSVGSAVPSTISTTAVYSLYNPQSSGKILALTRVRVSYTSGTMGAGYFVHGFNKSVSVTAPSGGTAAGTFPLLIGSGSTSVAAVRFAPTVVAPDFVVPFASSFAELATTANPFQQILEDVDGEFCILPGCCYQIQFAGTAGTSPVVSPSVVWEEINL